MADDRLTQPFVRTTTALTMFNAGVKENVVPQRAEARVNFRLLPGDTPDMVVSHIESVVDDPLVTISYDRWDNVPAVADYQGSGFAVISQAVATVYPEAIVVPIPADRNHRHAPLHRPGGQSVPVSRGNDEVQPGQVHPRH